MWAIFIYSCAVCVAKLYINRYLVFAFVWYLCHLVVDSSWNVMAHGDAREGKWRGNWWMEWVASTLHTTLEHGVSSITTADAHTLAASSWLNWCPCWFKWTRPFRRKTKSGFCMWATTFQLASCTYLSIIVIRWVALLNCVLEDKWEATMTEIFWVFLSFSS